MIDMNKIIVPIDFSDYSKKSLKYAIEFAKNFDAEIVLIYVVEPVIYPADFSFGQVAVPSMEAELRQRGEEQLNKMISAEMQGTIRARAVVRSGKPYSEIIQLALEEKADLIIIATHGYSGIEHALFGSTAEKVIRKAPCPVLTLREKEKEFIVP